MEGDEVGRNNVMEGDTNIRMGVYTSCTNNVNKNTYGICLVLLNSKLHAVLQFVQVKVKHLTVAIYPLLHDCSTMSLFRLGISKKQKTKKKN